MSYTEGAEAMSPDQEKPAGVPLGELDWRTKLKMLSGMASKKPMTPEQTAAMEFVRDMLEPGKLGGADRTFNDADIDAVVGALMKDAAGLSKEVQRTLQAEGKTLQANLVRRAFCRRRRGPIAKGVLKKVYSEAPAQVGGQLRDGLRAGDVDPATGENADAEVRQLTFDELRRFEMALAILQEMQMELSEHLGVDVTFPGGLSQSSMDHQLKGRLTAPPDARFSPR